MPHGCADCGADMTASRERRTASGTWPTESSALAAIDNARLSVGLPTSTPLATRRASSYRPRSSRVWA